MKIKKRKKAVDVAIEMFPDEHEGPEGEWIWLQVS